MIDTDKYEGHTEGEWEYADATIYATNKRGGRFKDNEIIAEYPCWNHNVDGLITKEEEANLRLMADAPLLLEFVQKVVEKWVEPNQCNQGFGEDVRQLMYEYGLITFNEETRRYEVKE